MHRETWKKLDDAFGEFPIMKAGPGMQSDIDEAAHSIGCEFHEDFREFLLRYGGAMVGAYPIFGVGQATVMGNDAWSITEMTKRFRREGWDGTADWYIVSMDGAGNPIGISPDGRVWISDHDAGAVSVIASDFEAFIARYCLA